MTTNQKWLLILAAWLIWGFTMIVVHIASSAELPALNERLVMIQGEKQAAMDKFNRALEIYNALRRMDQAEADYTRLEAEERQLRARIDAESKTENPKAPK